MSLQKRFEAEVVMIPQEMTAGSGLLSQMGQLGGLANLVGLGPSSKGREEALAVLRSRSFVSRFIQEQGIAGELEKSMSRSLPFVRNSAPERQIPMSDMVDFFDKSVRTVFDDKKTNAVKISITWHDPAIAAAWANAMAAQLNRDTRARAIEDAEFNIRYLTLELDSAKLVSLKNSIAELLQTEIQRLMMARGSREYAYRVVDPAVPPAHPVWPKLVPIMVLSMLVGILLAALWVILRFLAFSAAARSGARVRQESA